jgi:hypothetical protein
MAKINQKYFGNRNIGTGGQQLTVDENGNVISPADDKIGGEGVGSVTPNNEGSYTTALPTATFSAPDLPGGVTATGIVHGHALSASTTSNGSGYNFGDTLTVAGGTSTSAATFTVAATVVVAAVKSNGGSGYNDGDVLTFSTGFSPSLTLRVNRPGGGTGTPDNFTIVQAGRRTSANPTNPVAYDSRTGTGNGCTVTLTFGVYSFSPVVVQGDYTVIPASPVSFTGGGTGAAATVPFGVSGIEITEKGSGYTSVSDAAITFSGGTASYTPVLTTDSGAPGSSTNQENAIIAYAKTTSGGTSKPADIIKQRSTKRFKVKTADGTAICALVAPTAPATSITPAFGQMTIGATDSAGGTYYVTKIGARRCTLTQGTGTQFASDSSVPYTFGSAVANESVKIANA